MPAHTYTLLIRKRTNQTVQYGMLFHGLTMPSMTSTDAARLAGMTQYTAHKHTIK